MSRDYLKEFQARGGTVKKVAEGVAGQPPLRDFKPRLAATDHMGREVWVNDIGEPVFFG